MTCKPKEYPSPMDPPHEAISGPMQWDSVPTLIVPYYFSVPALCEGHPGLYQTSLEMTIIASLEILSGKSIKVHLYSDRLCVSYSLFYCTSTFLLPVFSCSLT